MRVVTLFTPSLPRIVPDGVFDGFAWCPGTTLEWRCPTETLVINALDDALPLGLAFVFRAPWPALPSELARLHTGRAQALALGLGDEGALAPYAIDDATDLLFEHRRAPTETFWLAADNLNGLYWALHDWGHFHNHGEFTDRPATEYQCDVSALAWLWINREAVGLPEARWESLVAEVLANHLELRAMTETTVCPPPALLTDLEALKRLAEASRGAVGVD